MLEQGQGDLLRALQLLPRPARRRRGSGRRSSSTPGRATLPWAPSSSAPPRAASCRSMTISVPHRQPRSAGTGDAGLRQRLDQERPERSGALVGHRLHQDLRLRVRGSRSSIPRRPASWSPCRRTAAPSAPSCIAKGKAKIFERAKCWECHGKQGRGDGQKSFDRKDDWGFPIRIRNVTHALEDQGRRRRSKTSTCAFPPASTARPMPSFVKRALNEDERW